MSGAKLKQGFMQLGFVLLCLLSQGCASNTPQTIASDIADKWFKSTELKGGEFILQVYYRFDQLGAPLSVYIEGDGKAWLNKNRASRNPSPRNPIGLKLAVRDPGKNVMYIARPCQYVSFEKNPQCDYTYWTNRRFAPEVIASVSAVIDLGKKKAKASKVNLIGYSGGGAVALLAAARRSDVTSIRTVAGNIDHRVWTKQHKVDSLNGSLNAADVADKVSAISQIHYVGERDKVIGRYVTESFIFKAGSENCIQLKMVSGATHTKGWETLWPKLIREKLPICGEK